MKQLDSPRELAPIKAICRGGLVVNDDTSRNAGYETARAGAGRQGFGIVA